MSYSTVFQRYRTNLIATVVALSCVVQPSQAQNALEEVVVTAQRREQSLMEVPISIEAVSGDELLQQGYRNMDDLANFSTSVLIDPDHLRNSITVRGFGATTADALTIEQSAPTFVDGIHYSRTNMIKLAFLDVERVEILKGPQPVYFGQNAIAGAFNITSRKPTPTWEGKLDADVGNFGRYRLDAGMGGPITDTLGVRVAGRYESQDGYLVDAISQNPYPEYENYGGRVILQWNPNDRFQATAKFEQTWLDQGSSNAVRCFIPGLIGTNQGVPVFDESLWADPPKGAGWPGSPTHLDFGENCFDGNVGRNSQPPWFPPPGNIIQNRRSFQVDMRETADRLFLQEHGVRATEGIERLQPWTTYLDLQYTLDNGIMLSSLTGYSDYHRVSNRENRYTPMLNNLQFRDEDFHSFTQELRATSPIGGTFEWMIGAYYQETGHTGIQDMLRNNTRRSRRYNEWDEEVIWRSLFGTVTYNMMDNRVSLDLGARVTQYDKATGQAGFGGRWILDDGSPDGLILPWGTSANASQVDDPRNGLTAIGWTDLVPNPLLRRANGRPDPLMGGPYDDITNPKARDSGTELDPQVVLRYRPTDNHSVYAKFAQAFKAGGANTGIAFVSPDVNKFSFLPEYATIYEAGTKGIFWEGRGRYNLAAFFSKITDLQIAASTPDDISAELDLVNAGQQSAKGIEVSVDTAMTDRWSVSLSAAFLDSVMDEYISPCTTEEFENAGTSGCDVETETIDRSGSSSPNAAKWKFVLTTDYTMPIWDNYQLNFNAKGFISDGYLTDQLGFSRVTSMDTHGDLNLQVGLGDRNDTWNLALYGRSLFEHRPSYHPEYDIEPNGIAGNSLYLSNFRHYGVKFQYNYR